MLRLWINIIYPVADLLRFVSPGSRKKFLAYFIKMNNRSFKNKRRSLSPKELLLLLPHCIQFDDCPHKITKNVLNCEMCGKCLIKSFIDIAREKDVRLNVATGGRMACRIVRELNPSAVIACACEEELSEGIRAVFPVPVFAIPNERPFGPCLNTTVDLEKIKEAILYLTGR